MLKVPTKTVDVGDTNIYEVKKGDTLYSIAKRYNTNVKDIMNKMNEKINCSNENKQLINKLLIFSIILLII